MRKPNILIVMTDHQRADTVLPEHPAVTPNVEQLGRDGVTFTNTFCPTPHCCPARATFFSGLYPSRHGVWNNVCNRQALSRGLNEGVRLWSEDLADAGYDMHYVGKWHVSSLESPADRGWQEHEISAGPGAFHGMSWERYRELASEPDSTQRGEGEILRPGYGTYRTYGGVSDEEWSHHDEGATEAALDLLPGLGATDTPWCLFVGLTSPHDPYYVPQKYLDLYDLEDIPLPPSYADEMGDKPHVYKRMRDMRWGQLSEREVCNGIRHFWAMCSYIDDQFGKLLEALDKAAASDNTLVLFCSDHGDYCGEHGLFCKGIPSFRGAYHVPAVVRWPAGIANPGRRVEAFVSLADVAPTLLDIAAAPSDRYFTGASLVPFLRDTTPGDWRDALHTQCNGIELYYTQRSVMTKDYKYVFNGFDVDELYNLRKDEHEMHNLAHDSEYEPVIRDMCRRMWRFAYEEDDSATNPYITVSLAPYGPAEAFR
ncbi:MAG: sulfatase-like hydrolase/transferase [Candidatus Pacebacteria bacterium]|nr:sulfatase-like hydrolase/transferase [Candidatus Paceibacterota bacterium]